MTTRILNPQALPYVSLANDGFIPQEKLAIEILREQLNQSSSFVPEFRDAHLLVADQVLKPAAVLILIVPREAGPTVLFTRRAAHLNDHAGQISFPGGRAETTDGSAVVTALRETEEEIGLPRAQVEVIGCLPEYITASGYRIVPVVGLVSAPFELRPDVNEVESVFQVPLAFLMNGANHERRIWSGLIESGERVQREFYAMQFEDDFIWGATAGIVRNLFYALNALEI